MRKRVGPGDAAPQRRLAWPQLGPVAGKRGFFQGGNITIFAALSVAFPHPWPVPAVAPGEAVPRADGFVAGEERVDAVRPHLPREAAGMCPLDPALSRAWGSAGSLAALSQPCSLHLRAAARPGPLPRSCCVSAALPWLRLRLNCCPGVGRQILSQINVFPKGL